MKAAPLYLVGGIVMFAMGHWIAGIVLLILFILA
jgi:hypothetical protein